MTFDGVVLAGGSATRLGGMDKPGLSVGGRRLLDVAIDALVGADRIVVVGPTLTTEATVTWTREHPVGGGPVAALATALAHCLAEEIVVLAADLPFVTADAVTTLRSRRGAGAAAIAVDDRSHDQPLLGCYNRIKLAAAMPDPAHGASMRSITNALGSSGAIVRVNLGGDPPVAWDCDTAADLDRAREQV